MKHCFIIIIIIIHIIIIIIVFRSLGLRNQNKVDPRIAKKIKFHSVLLFSIAMMMDI